MKLKELSNKIDNNTYFCIVEAENNKTVFRKKHDYDVVPKDLLDGEVEAFFSNFRGLNIHVKRKSNPLKGSFRELLDKMNGYEYINVYVVNHDGEKEKVYSHGIAFAISDEFDDYLVKKVSSQWIDWNAEIDIVIEPCEEMKENEKE